VALEHASPSIVLRRLKANLAAPYKTVAIGPWQCIYSIGNVRINHIFPIYGSVNEGCRSTLCKYLKGTKVTLGMSSCPFCRSTAVDFSDMLHKR